MKLRKRGGVIMVFAALLLVFSLKPDVRSASTLELTRTNFAKGAQKIDITSVDVEVLIDEYERWRDTYVTAVGCPESDMLRVQRDSTTNYDTVSEGQAYGLLLAVAFNDYETYKGLKNYYFHYCKYGPNDEWGCMHWKINRYGFKVSEFNIPFEWRDDPSHPMKHGPAYAKISHLLDLNAYPDPTYWVDISQSAKDSGLYRRAQKYNRGHSSATDADMDAMAAFIYASYKWRGAANVWAALRVMGRIFDNQIGGDNGYYDDANHTPKEYSYDYFVRAGCQWGGPKAFNPSYYMPAWHYLAIKFLEDVPVRYKDDATQLTKMTNILKSTRRWAAKGGQVNVFTAYKNWNQKVIDTMDPIMNRIAAENKYSLAPDWCDVSGSTIKAAAQSDRLYYVDRELINHQFPTDTLYEVASFNPAYIDDYDGNLQYFMHQSYNTYYDAIRVYWRQLQSFQIWGDSNANAYLKQGAYHWNTRKNYRNIKDGYYWKTGGHWAWNYRDSFNMNIGGEDSSAGESPTFVCMASILSMYRSSWDSAKTAYYYVKASQYMDPDNYDNHYYGNALRMLTMVHMAGGLGKPGNLK